MFIVIGTALAAGKGRASSGFVWTFLLGPLGLLIVIFLPDLKKRELERQKKQYAESVRLQKEQLKQLEALSKVASPQLVSSPSESRFRIARNGEDIGEMPLSKINALLRAEKLTKQDYYFDSQLNEWVQLEHLVGLSIP